MGKKDDESKPATTVRQPLPEPEGGWPADEFTGLGGSYVRDPYTGVRSRAAAVVGNEGVADVAAPDA
jgi:hypothetical protein